MRRPIVAMGACLGAYLLQPWASVLAPTAAVIANAICFAVLSLCVRSLVARPLRETACSEPQAEMAVANPQSFLPTGHLLFVAIFGLTPRESEVFALLAQGRTVGRDSREACHLAEHGPIPHEEYLCEVGGAFPTGAHRSGGGFRAVRVRDVRVLRCNRASWSPGREGRYGRTPARCKKPRCRNEGCSGVLTSEGLRVGRPQDVRGRLTPGC